MSFSYRTSENQKQLIGERLNQLIFGHGLMSVVAGFIPMFITGLIIFSLDMESMIKLTRKEFLWFPDPIMPILISIALFGSTLYLGLVYVFSKRNNKRGIYYVIKNRHTNEMV